MGEGITIQWEKWAVADGLRGFHERMPKRLDSQYVEHRTQECKRGLECGEYSLPPTQDAKELVRLGYMISPIFFVDKAERKTVRKAQWEAMSLEEQADYLRLIANMKRLNLRVRGKRCRMHGLKGMSHMAKKGVHTHATTADVKGAYKLVGVRVNQQKYMCLDFGTSVEGTGVPRFVCACTLPMGYKLSPLIWTAVMKRPVAAIRSGPYGRPGIPTVVWLDDLLHLHKSNAEGRLDQVAIDRVLVDHFGEGARHPKKGEGWGPEGPVTFVKKQLGTAIDLERGLFLTTKTTAAQLKRTAKQILRSLTKHARWIGARWIAEFAGLCISTFLSNNQALFRCRPFHIF